MFYKCHKNGSDHLRKGQLHRRHTAGGRGGGGNPAKDRHAVKGRVPILLGLLHAKETGISSSCLEYAPPFYVH